MFRLTTKTVFLLLPVAIRFIFCSYPPLFTSALPGAVFEKGITASSKMASGRIAVVTGANKGIGYHIALQLASSGVFTNVIMACRDESRGNAALSQIRKELSLLSSSSYPCEVSCIPLVVGDAKSHSTFRKTIQERFHKVDVLVNNAAMAFKGSSTVSFVGQCKPTLDVNFRGTLDFTEEMLPLIRRVNGGDARIVNVASMAGKLSQIKNTELRQRFESEKLTMEELRSMVNSFESDVSRGVHKEVGWGGSNYGMSKLALIAATKVWATDEAVNNVKVNCCCPGYCDTDMTSHRGPRHPGDGAGNAVLPATMEKCPTGAFFQDMSVSQW